ncbi:MAG: hypothetical protein V1647_05950 [Pseudomonadota bacterium]
MKKLLFVLTGSILLLASCSSSNSLTGTATIVGNVGTDIIPASLAYTSTNSSSVNINTAPTENPCTEFESTYGAASVGACQPKLIRLYLDMVKEFIANTKIFMEDIGSSLGELADGATGTAAGPNGTQVQYTKTDSTHYTVLITANGTGAGYINVAGSDITVKMDFSAMGETDSNALGNLDGTFNYTDSNNYTATVTMSDVPCNANDVGGPRNVRVIVTKTAGLWTGYSMLYHPFWGGDHAGYTCSTTETDATEALVYSNFVGNNTAAKVNTYMMKRTLSDTTFQNSLANYSLNNICSTDPTIFSDGCAYAPTTMATFINSFCNPASTLVATWNSDCTGVEATVQATSFPTGGWTTPSTFYNIETTFSIPSTL